MAKHKPISRIVIAGLGIGVLLAVIVPVMIFVFGVGFDVAPNFEKEFEIPFITPEQEQVNQDIIKQIDEVISDPQINPENKPELIKVIADESTIIPLPSNETIFSEDPPIVQIGDITNNPVLPQSPSLDLVTRITKQDSQGNRIAVEKTTAFKFAFLVEDTSNIDYKNGFLEIEMFVNGKPNTAYSGTGTFDIQISGQSIFQTPITINLDEISDINGMIPVHIISPTGSTSNLYTFDFNANFNKFVNEAITKIDVKIITLDVTDKDLNKFSIQNTLVFEMDIARDDIQLIVTDETGVISRIYPTDSRIVVTSVQASSQGAYCTIGIIFGSTVTGKTSGSSPADCLYNFPPPNYASGASLNTWHNLYPISYVSAGTAPAPQILGLNLFDQDGKILKSSGGGTGTVFDNLVIRNENYTLKINTPVISSELSFGKAQQTQSYSCQSKVTTNYKISTTTVPAQSGCGFTNSCFSTTYYTLAPNGISIGVTQCNFP